MRNYQSTREDYPFHFHKWLFFGSQSNDVLIGNDRSNLIFAGRGDDLVGGGGGKDWIFAGSGNNFVDGGSGNDRIFARPGDGETVTVTNGIAGDIGWLLRAAPTGNSDPDEPTIPDTIIWDIDGDEDLDTSGQGESNTVIRDVAGGVDRVSLGGEGSGVGLLVLDVDATNTTPDQDEPQVPDTIIWDIDGDEDTSGSTPPKVVTKIAVIGHDEPRIDLAAALDTVEFRASADGYHLDIGGQNATQVNGVKAASLGELVDTGAIELAYRGTVENETIKGSDAKDLIFAGAGFDTIFGGAQSDTIVFAPGSEGDVVSDYDAREGDAVDLRRFDHDVAQRAIDTATVDGNGLSLDFGNDDTLQLIGITDASDVDFLLA